jgi:dynein light intermediate chain 1, cytosolic
LGEVQSRGNKKLPTSKSVLVLGNELKIQINYQNLIHLYFIGENESGKTTLIAKLQGVEDPKKGSGLEYAYIDVRDEYRDGTKLLFDSKIRFKRVLHFLDNTRLRVWVLDGDPEHSHLLEFALNEETFADTTIMFTVSMTTPWAMLEQLQNWTTLLQDHIDKLNLSADFIQERKQTSKEIIIQYLQLIYISSF